MSASLPSWVRVGAKVVVVSVRPLPFGDMPPFSLNEVVTISDVVPAGCIALVEYPRPVGFVISYMIQRFRPLVDDEAQERDVAIFRHMLNQPELVE